MSFWTDSFTLYRSLFITSPLAFAIFNAILGLLVGSFLNVVALRSLSNESVVYPPSHCTHCKHKLSLLDLIPVLSYLALRAKCRYCKHPISARYLVWESATSVLFILAGLVLEPSAEWLISLLFVSILIVITQTDLKEMIIPDRVVLFGALAILLMRWWHHPLPFSQYIYGMLAGSGMLLLIALISSLLLKKEAMGGGDVKLFGFIGLVLGVKLTLFAFFLACLAGTLLGVILIAARIMKRDQYLPFGPYIALGSLVSYFWGEACIQWYLSLIS